MFRYLAVLLLMVMCIGGCAVYPDLNQVRLESLPQRYEKFDAVLAWEVRDAGPGMIIDGEFKNVRYAYMEDVEVWVVLLDPAGKRVARGVGYVIPQLLPRDEVAPFTVKLPVRALPGTKLQFTYKYKGLEGGSDGGGFVGPWMQSFDVVVPAR